MPLGPIEAGLLALVLVLLPLAALLISMTRNPDKSFGRRLFNGIQVAAVVALVGLIAVVLLAVIVNLL